MAINIAQCPLTGEWRDELGYIQYNGTLLSNRSELSIPVMWMNPKLIMLSERSQMKKEFILYDSICIRLWEMQAHL